MNGEDETWTSRLVKTNETYVLRLKELSSVPNSFWGRKIFGLALFLSQLLTSFHLSLDNKIAMNPLAKVASALKNQEKAETFSHSSLFLN